MRPVRYDFRRGLQRGLVLGLPHANDGADEVMGIDSLEALVPFQPTTWRTFERGDTLRVFAREAESAPAVLRRASCSRARARDF